jgi:hypothetical protein
MVGVVERCLKAEYEEVFFVLESDVVTAMQSNRLHFEGPVDQD